MAYFKRNRFTGIAPGVAPRLLGEEFAQTAENIDFESGKLAAIESDSTVYSNSGLASMNSVYYYEYSTSSHKWLYWSGADVSVVTGPIPGDIYDRLYYTGDTYPRMTRSDIVGGSASGHITSLTSFRLGVPAPTAAPTVATGSVSANNALTTQDVSYVYTYVTAFGEEGPPSPASTAAEFTTNQQPVITFTNAATPSLSGWNNGSGALIRLYRSNTGSEATRFQFVSSLNVDGSGVSDGAIPYAKTAGGSVTDTSGGSNLGEVLPSETWVGPPDNNANSTLYPEGSLEGLIPLAQGVMAGFVGKRFCLSEPFLPHAWPVSYRITVEEDIIGIASTANGVVALTKAHPYFITGTDPSAMTSVRVDLAQACINKDSIVDMGDYVLYAGPDGLCAVQSASGEVISKGFISVEQWNDATGSFRPTIYKAFRYEGTYVAFYSSGGTDAGWVYDPKGGTAVFSTISGLSAAVKGGFERLSDGQLFILQGNNNNQYRGGTTNRTLTWKSKKYVTPSAMSMSWLSLEATTYPTTGMVLKAYADGTLFAHYTLQKNLTAVTFAVTVVNSGGNKFAFDGGSAAPVLTLRRGVTYTFDQSDASNSGHQLAFKDSGGSSYTTGVTNSGTLGQAGAKTVFVVAANAPDSLRYYCVAHGNGMGNTITVTEFANFTLATTVPNGISTVDINESVMRLPATVAKEWELEVSGDDVDELCIAQDIEELRSV